MQDAPSQQKSRYFLRLFCFLIREKPPRVFTQTRILKNPYLAKSDKS